MHSKLFTPIEVHSQQSFVTFVKQHKDLLSVHATDLQNQYIYQLIILPITKGDNGVGIASLTFLHEDQYFKKMIPDFHTLTF